MRITKNILTLSCIAALFLSAVSCAELGKNSEDKNETESASEKTSKDKKELESSTGIPLDRKQELFTKNTSPEDAESDAVSQNFTEEDLSPSVAVFCELLRRQMAIQVSDEADQAEYEAINKRIKDELSNDTTRLTDIDKAILSNHMHQMYSDEMLDNAIQSMNYDEKSGAAYKAFILGNIDKSLEFSETLGDFISSF